MPNDPALVAILVASAVAIATLAGALAATLLIVTTSDEPEDGAG